MILWAHCDVLYAPNKMEIFRRAVWRATGCSDAMCGVDSRHVSHIQCLGACTPFEPCCKVVSFRTEDQRLHFIVRQALVPLARENVLQAGREHGIPVKVVRLHAARDRERFCAVMP